MKKALLSKLYESVVSVIPVAIIVLLVSFLPFVSFSWGERINFIICAALLVIGIALFNLGADLSMTPMGKHVGVGLTKSRKIKFLVIICFFLGVLITIAEPDLAVLAEQIKLVIKPNTLIFTVGLGVGLFLAIAIIRIVTKTDLTALLLFSYMLLFAFSALLIAVGSQNLLPVSFDSGGVTTGPITVPFIMALGIGIAQTLGGRNASQNSFGLIALCSVGPVLAVLVLSLNAGGNTVVYPLPDYSAQLGFTAQFLDLVKELAIEVAKSLVLIVAFFFILQFKVLHLPKKKIIQILIGVGFTFVGLVIFLIAATAGFMPMGYQIGLNLAAANSKILVVFAFIIGMVVVLAEPAVHVLNVQVEEVTDGAISRKSMMLALSIGVGVSICLSIIRLIFGFSLLYYLIPGYLLSLGLSFFVPKIYTAIAFDSGGVASGPLTSSFILPMIIGACVSLRGVTVIMDYAFGVVALVAMTPLITIQSLGFKAVFARFMKEEAAVKKILDADDGQIIYFKWGK